jgi:hypothetical protein
MISSGVKPMDERGIQFDPLGLGSLFSCGVIQAKLAAILRRWTERRRPAIHFVLSGEPPHAAVYGEDELLTLFKGTPIVKVEPIGSHVLARLLVFVSDGQETAGYQIADPRGIN